MVRIDCREEVFVELLDFKGRRGREFVTANEDGSFTIVVNSRLSFDAQKDAVEHALYHIEHHDFEKDNVQEIEAYAHKIAEEKKAEAAAMEAERQRQEQLKELQDYFRKKFAKERIRLEREMREHQWFMKIYQQMNPNYFSALEQQYYDPDLH